jgi:hypothetical protein
VISDTAEQYCQWHKINNVLGRARILRTPGAKKKALMEINNAAPHLPRPLIAAGTRPAQHRSSGALARSRRDAVGALDVCRGGRTIERPGRRG